MLNITIRRKGGPSSGWYSPPKGTHSGDKHRAVGSGKAGVVGKANPEYRSTQRKLHAEARKLRKAKVKVKRGG